MATAHQRAIAKNQADRPKPKAVRGQSTTPSEEDATPIVGSCRGAVGVAKRAPQNKSNKSWAKGRDGTAGERTVICRPSYPGALSSLVVYSSSIQPSSTAKEGVERVRMHAHASIAIWRQNKVHLVATSHKTRRSSSFSRSWGPWRWPCPVTPRGWPWPSPRRPTWKRRGGRTVPALAERQ